MTTSARSALPFTLAEVDLLCAAANSAPPYPLRVPTHGTSITERRAVLRHAGERLAARGLADERGPLGVAEAFAYLLQGSTHTLDLLLCAGADVLGVVLVVRQDLAVLVTQQLGGDPVAPGTDPDTEGEGGIDRDVIHVAELPVDDAVDELIAVVPACEPAMTSPFSLPTGLLSRVHDDLRRDPDNWGEILAAHGLTDRLARRLVTHLQPVLGNGQVGLATRGGYANAWRRTGEEIRWLDTERGRFQLVAGDGEWTSVNPMYAADLAAAVRRLAGALPR